MSPMNTLNRRTFLHTLGASAAGAAAALSGAARAEAPKPARERIPTRVFGRSGVRVPILSLGGMFDIVSNQLILRQALNWGVTYWDTAAGYNGGRSEEGIGRFFAARPEARKNIFLVTKASGGGNDPARMSQLLDQSLKRMNTDHVDLYFIHAMRDASDLTPAVRTWAEQRKREGKIKLFGFSTHNDMPELLQAAAKLDWIDGVMFTYNYRLMREDGMRAAVDAAHAAGIGLTAMKTQGGGPVKTDSESELDLAGRFLEKGFAEGQAKLLAVWNDPRIAALCSQMPTMNLLTANLAAALNQVELDARDLAAFDALNRDTCDAYCAGCTRHCEPALGNRIEIGKVMRALMYAQYGDLDFARDTFAELPPAMRAGLGAAEYGPAEAACPRHLPIARLMREASTRFA